MDERNLPEDYADFLAAVLKDLQDGDLDGVYDIWWYANSRYPQLLLSHRLALAERVVSDLIKGGRVALALERHSEPRVKRPGGRPWLSAVREPIPVDEWADTLLEWTTWVPQEEGMVVIEAIDDRSVAEKRVRTPVGCLSRQR